jgi:hypothetical protein
VTRQERIAELDLMIQELQAEERIAAWLVANQGRASIVITGWKAGHTAAALAPWFQCIVICDGAVIAKSTGRTESDARAQAFSAILSNEAADAAGVAS